MTFHLRKALVALSVASCVASSPEPAAAAACWGPADIAAARLREMQTKLAVAALQCRFSRADIRASYNGYLRNGRSALIAANARLKAHFGTQSWRGQRAYDKYITVLANAYGGNQISFGSCARISAVMAEAAMPNANLQSLAAREVMSPKLPVAPCLASRSGAIAVD